MERLVDALMLLGFKRVTLNASEWWCRMDWHTTVTIVDVTSDTKKIGVRLAGEWAGIFDLETVGAFFGAAAQSVYQAVMAENPAKF